MSPSGNFPRAAGVPYGPDVADFGITRRPRTASLGTCFGGPDISAPTRNRQGFGLPKMKVLGENAKLHLRANFYNLFNKLNLKNRHNHQQ